MIQNNDSVFRDNREFASNDVVHLFNRRVKILLKQEDSDSKAFGIVFDESALDEETRNFLLSEGIQLSLFARDVIPDNDNMTTVVIN